MEHTGPLLAAIRDALNLTGVAALITGIFLITKGRSDQHVLMEQLKQKTQADDRDDDREDAKAIAERATAAASIMDKAAAAAQSSAEYWRLRCKEAQDELDARNARLTDLKTNASEMFDLLAVPGAMPLLKAHREQHQQSQI